MNTNMNNTFITLLFNDNVTLKLSTSSFLYEGSNFLQLFDIEEDNNIPILCPSTYVLDENNDFYFDKYSKYYIFTSEYNISIDTNVKICIFLDKIEYEYKYKEMTICLGQNKYDLNDKCINVDILPEENLKTSNPNELFILYVMKHNLIHQLKDLHVFMRDEIKSILNYVNNESVDIQIRTCTPSFYNLYLSKYIEEVVKYNRLDIFNNNLNINKFYLHKYRENEERYYKYIHKYNNHFTYYVKGTFEYNNYRYYISTLLGQACYECNDFNNIKELVENGANVNVVGTSGSSALHYASKIPNNLEIIQYLVENGANVNLQNMYGYAALHIAARVKNNIKVIKYLVENGADVKLKDNYFCTALDKASMKYKYSDTGYTLEYIDNIEIVEYLQKFI